MKNRILILTELTVPYSSGSGINAFNFAKVLVKKSCKVKILTLNWGWRYKCSDVRSNIKIKRIPFSYNKYFNRVLTLLLLIPYFKYQLFSYNVVLIYGRFPGFKLIVLLGWLFGKKVIFQSTALGHDDFGSLLKCDYRFGKWILKKINIYFSLTPAFSAIFKEHLINTKTKLFESPQGVDTLVFSPKKGDERDLLKKKLQIPLDKKIIITIANVIKRKGFEGIFNTLRKLDHDFVYLVLGNAESTKKHYFWQNRNEMKYLKEMGEELLGDKILYLGKKENVNEYLAVSDILLLNSEKEGLPNAILEAMACNVVPVVKKIEGLKNYIVFPEQNAIVFECDEEMKNSLIRLFQNEEIGKELSENALRFIQEYSMEKVVDRFLKELTL